MTDVSAALHAAWVPVSIRLPANPAEAEAARKYWRESQRLADFKARVLATLAERERSENEVRRWDQAEQAARERAFAERRALHPRWGEWRQLPDSELKRLVWEKQLTALAAEFGVSDMAIRKRCDARRIDRPPQGFWLRGEARLEEA